MGNQLQEVSDAIGADKVGSPQPTVSVRGLQNATRRIYGQRQVIATAFRDDGGTLTVMAVNIDQVPQTAVTMELALHGDVGDVNQSDAWAYLPFEHAPLQPRGGTGTGTRGVPIVRCKCTRARGAAVCYTWTDFFDSWGTNIYRINETWAGLGRPVTNLATDPSFEDPPAVAGFPGSAGFPLIYWQLAQIPNYNGFGSGWTKTAKARTVVGSSVSGRHSLEVHIPRRFRPTMGLLVGMQGSGLVAGHYHLSFYAQTAAVESGCLLSVSIAARNSTRATVSHRGTDRFMSFSAGNTSVDLTNNFVKHTISFSAPPLPWSGAVPYFHSLDCASYRLDDVVLNLLDDEDSLHRTELQAMKTDDTPLPSPSPLPSALAVSSVSPDRCPTISESTNVLQVSGHGFDVSSTNATCKVTSNYWGWGFNEIRVTTATVVSSTLVHCQCPPMTGFNGSAELAGNVTLSVCFAGVANCTDDGFDAKTLLSYYKVLDATVSRRPFTHETEARLLLNIDLPTHKIPPNMFVRASANGWSMAAVRVLHVGRSSVPLPLPLAPFNDLIQVTLHASENPSAAPLSSIETRLIRLAEAKDNEVKLDYESRSLTVHSRPFFGSGWFAGGGPTPDHLQTLAARGINYVIGYGTGAMSQQQADAYMDSAEASGLKVAFDIYVFCYMLIGSTHGAGPMQKDVERWEHVTSLVERYRNHPALLGWYTADDTTFYYRDNMRLLYVHIKSLDPHHPQFVTLSGYDGAYIYSDCYDIGMPEEYDELHGIGPVGDTLRPLHIMRQFPYAWDPLWLCGQGFQPIWSQELNAQFWLTVIKGGTGVGWFFDAVETRTTRWRLLSESQRAALAVHDISRAVVANSSVVQHFTAVVNETAGLLAGAFQEEETGCVFVIVLNLGSPTLARVTIPEVTQLTNVTVPYERGRALVVRDGVIEPPESIDAMQSRIYQLHHGAGCVCLSNACAKATAGTPPLLFGHHRRAKVAPPPPPPRNMVQNPGCEESVDAGQCDWWLFVVGDSTNAVDSSGVLDEHPQLSSSPTYRIAGRRSLKIVSPSKHSAMHVPWPGAAIRATSSYAVSFYARSDIVGQSVNLVNYNNSCLPRMACSCGGNYSGCTHSYTQVKLTYLLALTIRCLLIVL
jgi:hypothetical protein